LSSIRSSHVVWVVAGVFGAVGCAVGYLEWSFSYVTAGLIGLVWLSISMTAVVLVARGLVSRRRLATLSGVGLVLVLAVSLLLVRKVDTRRKAESMHRGDAIVAALSSFRAERGRYPGSLAELSPKFLHRIPSTASAALHDVPFQYRLSDRDGFELSFPASAWLVCHRAASTTWACDD
jgi:hypothetical protein